MPELKYSKETFKEIYEALKGVVDVLTLLGAEGLFLTRGMKHLGERATKAEKYGLTTLAKAKGKE